jgi:hypothetical protein
VKKVIVILLIFISIISIIFQFGSKPLGKVLGIQNRSGIRVESTQKTKVLLNNQEAGETPFQSDTLPSGDYLITLKTLESTPSGVVAWEGYAKLNPGTLTVVNREITDKKETSSGEIIALEAGSGVTVISTPTDAEVIIDGEVKGRTPVTLPDITPGEHQFIISKDNFLKRSIRAKVLADFKLVLTVDLAISEADLTKIPVVPITQTAQVTIKKTPTGFLRVREKSNINSKEVAQVKVGETLVLLEEIPNWNRVRLSDGKEGWVSSSYTEKQK